MKNISERIIASMITTLFITGAITSFGLGTYAGSQQTLAEQAFNDNMSKQIEIYDMVKKTKIFQDEYATRFDYYSNEYNTNNIDYGEYAKQISYLDSYQFVEEVIDMRGNDELNSELHTMKLYGNDLKHISSSCKKVKEACAITTGLSGLISCVGLTHSLLQSCKDSTDDEEYCQ